MKMMKKLIALLTALALTVGLSAMTVSATDVAPSLRISALNLSLDNAVYMVFKVSDENVGTDDIRLLLWKDAPEAYTKGTEDACLSPIRYETDKGYTVFGYSDIAAKDMTENVYVCAYANVDGVEVYSAPTKYSVVMYAYLKQHSSSSSPELLELLDAMLAYGALAQKYFGHNEDFLATDEVYQINVTNGILADGFNKGWYNTKTTVTLTANAPEEGFIFSHWEDSTGYSIGTTETVDFPVTGDETYTAVYVEG